ncbi:MAG: alpha/beta hydrolase [Candidatus Levybacteria bacterium]|nr:alpha/beta hydrolase [Candidatus Levybacteria bacterium]
MDSKRVFTHYIPKSIHAADGVKLYYEIDDNPRSHPPIFFLHGLGGDATAWDAERLALYNKGYTTISLDLRGHGLSGRADDEASYALPRFAEDILRLLQEENIKKCILVGHCFGGFVAMQATYFYQTYVEALVLIDSNDKPPRFSEFIVDHALVKKVVHLIGEHLPNIGSTGHVDFSKYVGTSDYDKKRLLSDVLHTHLRSYFFSAEQFFTADLREVLKKITVPTLIMHGAEDTIFPPEVAKKLQKKIKTSEVAFVPGANHIVVINNPVELVRLLDNFLQKLPATTASTAKSAARRPTT